MAGKYDLIVVGGGTSGLEAAKTAARNGLKVALIERKTDPAKIQRSCRIAAPQLENASENMWNLVKRAALVELNR